MSITVSGFAIFNRQQTSSSLFNFFLLVGCFGSTNGGRFLASSAAVSDILWIWFSTRTGVSCRGDVDKVGYSLPLTTPIPLVLLWIGDALLEGLLLPVDTFALLRSLFGCVGDEGEPMLVQWLVTCGGGEEGFDAPVCWRSPLDGVLTVIELGPSAGVDDLVKFVVELADG